MIKKLSISSIKDYFKTIINCSNWYIGKIDKNKEEAIAIYSNKRPLNKISNFKNLQTYDILPITLLLRYTKNYKNAEIKANEIYELLDHSSFFVDKNKCSVECLYNGPIDLGSDENGIYEFSIELDLIYKSI